MDAAIPADAQNAPTGIWKSRTEREIPTAPTPIIVVVNERKNNGDSNSVAKPSTESDQAQSASAAPWRHWSLRTIHDDGLAESAGGAAIVLAMTRLVLVIVLLVEDVDFNTPRGLNREVVLSLGTGGWIRDHHHLLITGPTGIGKSWLASAFVQSACRHGFTATYVRAPRLLHDLAVSRGDGSYGRLLAKLAKLDLLAIDDWLLAPLTDAERRDLLEVLEDRSERTSTLIASQLPPTAWHAAIGEPSVADAICDRLIHHAHRLTLKGPTMRDPGTRRGGKAKG